MLAELQRMENMDVISKIEEPTKWCSGVVHGCPQAEWKHHNLCRSHKIERRRM